MTSTIMNFHLPNDIAFEFDGIFRIESYALYQTYSVFTKNNPKKEEMNRV